MNAVLPNALIFAVSRKIFMKCRIEKARTVYNFRSSQNSPTQLTMITRYMIQRWQKYSISARHLLTKLWTSAWPYIWSSMTIWKITIMNFWTEMLVRLYLLVFTKRIPMIIIQKFHSLSFLTFSSGQRVKLMEIRPPNNRINLTRNIRVRFWALLVARAGYANR